MRSRGKVRWIDAITIAVLIAASWRLWSSFRPTGSEPTISMSPARVPAGAVASVWDSLVALSDELSPAWDDEGIIMVSDFECEYCRRSVAAVDSILAEGVAVRYLHQTRGARSRSDDAARFAHCGASDADPFVNRYRRLMTSNAWRSSSSGRNRSWEGATPQLEECMESAETSEKLEASRALANALGVRGTPMFISKRGVLYGQSSVAALRSIVAEDARASQRPARHAR